MTSRTETADGWQQQLGSGAYVGDVGEAEEEGDDADDEHEPLLALQHRQQLLAEVVHQRRDHHLHRRELQPKAS